MHINLFIVTVVIYDHFDNNLYSAARAFSNKEKAQNFFRSQSDNCWREARGKNLSDNPNDFYPVSIECDSDTRKEYIQDTDTPQHYEVKITQQEIEL